MPNTMYQVSTLQALMMGDYEGHISIRALLKKGDTGLGTFDSLYGEMILLDGICYRALEDGHVEVSQEEDRSPFAVTSFLKEEATAYFRAFYILFTRYITSHLRNSIL